jgi:small multidrug resistance pump
MWLTYLYLGIAIVCEVIATSSLKSSDGLTRLWPSMISLVGYVIALLLLSLTLRTLPTGIAYAIWSGVGIVLVSMIAWIGYGQRLDTPAMIGLGLIIVGVIVVNVFSKSIAH